MAGLLPFHRQIVRELVSDDGLCILAAGLGWQKVVAVLLQLQVERLKRPGEVQSISGTAKVSCQSIENGTRENTYSASPSSVSVLSCGGKVFPSLFARHIHQASNIF